MSFAFAVGYTAGFIFIIRMDTTYASPAGSRCAGSSPPGAGTLYVTKEASPVAFCPVGYCPVGSYSGSRSRATGLTTAIRGYSGASITSSIALPISKARSTAGVALLVLAMLIP